MRHQTKSLNLQWPQVRWLRNRPIKIKKMIALTSSSNSLKDKLINLSNFPRGHFNKSMLTQEPWPIIIYRTKTPLQGPTSIELLKSTITTTPTACPKHSRRPPVARLQVALKTSMMRPLVHKSKNNPFQVLSKFQEWITFHTQAFKTPQTEQQDSKSKKNTFKNPSQFTLTSLNSNRTL